MTTYHTLAKPLRKAPDGRIVWQATCGLEVLMPPQKFSVGTVAQVPDKHGSEVVECAGCYAGTDQAEPEIGGDDQERLQAPGTEMDDEDPFKVVNEEREDYPAEGG